MIRYLIVGALLYLAGLLLRRWLADRRGSSKPPTQPPATTGEATARCAHCGLFLPRADALVDGDRYYCSREHLQADRPSS